MRPIFCVCAQHIAAMAGLGKNLVQVFATLPDLHWELLRLWTGFELSSSWSNLPCYGVNLNRNILDFMRWPQIDLGAQDLNDIQRQKSFKKHLPKKVSPIPTLKYTTDPLKTLTISLF
jgi:hypothetical protein